MNIDNCCFNCFEELTNGNVCENCGYDNDSLVDIIYLRPKTVLNNRYVVGRVVSHESDAAVYMAYDNQLDEVVSVREFLPKNIANRLEGNSEVHVRERFKASFENYKQSFINLWSTLIKIRNLSAVVPTYDIFEENQTAYAVSEYMESITLREFLLRNPDGNIPWDKVRIMFMPVLTTLEALHSNEIIHGAICPDNLVLCRDGKVRLRGFCISDSNVFGTDLEFNVNEGYTALEQYDNKHKVCPATDIYAFCACVFRALVGQNPPDAKSREINDKLMIPNVIAEKIPTYVIKAIGAGIQIYPEKRVQDVNTLRELFNVAPTVVAAAGSSDDAQKDSVENEEYYRGYPGYDEPTNKKGKVIIGVLVVLIALAVAVGVYVAQNGGFDFLSNQEDTTQEVTEAEQYDVPDFVTAGYTQSDIENNGVWNEQFTISFDAQYSTDVEEGIIFKQSVEAGESVDKGTEIVLTVSKGIETATVPNVSGLTLEEATKQLEELGFTVTTVEIYNDGSHIANTVKSSYGSAPAANEVVAVGEEIILQVYGEVQTTTTTTTTQSDDD